MTGYDLLLEKLDAFARKYYLNKILRGSLVGLSIFLTVFLFFNYLEFKFYFSPSVRTVLFYSFLGSLLVFLGIYVFHPLLQYFRLGKQIDKKQSAKIIGQHFSEIEDKLLNILDLHDQRHRGVHSDLLLASIEQKADKIKLVPFQRAIDLSENKKYLRLAILPILLLLFLVVKLPSIITDSTYRYVHFNQPFEKEAPFDFLYTPPNHDIFQFMDLPISLTLSGDMIPDAVDILINGYQYRMENAGVDSFFYIVNNLQNNVTIQFVANGFYSKQYEIQPLGRPRLLDFSMLLDYPAYTKKRDETLRNTGDAIVPEGTRITWKVKTVNTDYAQLQPFGALDQNDQDYSLTRNMLESQGYTLAYGLKQHGILDSLAYDIVVIKDRRPNISVKKFEDSISSNSEQKAFFLGEVADDYGVSDVAVVSQIFSEDGTPLRRDSASIRASVENGLFRYMTSTTMLGLSLGEYAQLYFIVFDNDAINGRKSAKTQTFSFNKPSLEALKEREEMAENDILNKAKSIQQKQLELRKSARELRDNLLQEKNINWQHEKQLDELLKKHDDIQQESEQLKQTFDELKKEQEQYKESTPEEEQLEKTLEELMEQTEKDKMEELLEKMKELFEKQNKDEAINTLNQTEEQSEQQEMDYERLLELYKKLEVETDLQDKIDELQKMAEEQRKLSESDMPNPEQQEKLNEKFEQLEKEMDDLMDKNEDLKRPLDIPDNKGDRQEIKMNMEKALQNSKPSGDQQKRKQSQKDAAEQMEDMADQMQSGMQNSQEQQAEEDMKMIRQLLENLVTLSFDQEEIFSKVNSYNDRQPAYKRLVQSQHQIQQDWGLLKDSLVELSLRQPTIATFISQNISEVDHSLEKALDFMEDRRKSTAIVHERKVMTHLNELALMLDESLQNLQKQMSSMKKSSAMCNKPKNNPSSNPGSKNPQNQLSKGQQKLTEEMKKRLEEYKKSGQEGKKGMNSEDFAKMAAEQAEIRKALQKKSKELQEKGKGQKQLDNIANEMDKIETDLVNKRLTNDMLRRQQDIITRLLEAEKAEREQDWDDKRKSETAQNVENIFPKALEEYLRSRQNQEVEVRTTPAELRPFYQRLVERYYENFKS